MSADLLFSNLQDKFGRAEDTASANKRVAESIKKSLFPKQMQVMDDPHRMKAAICPRRVGKSWMAISYAYYVALTKPGAVVPIVCLTLKAAKNVYWNSVLPRFNRTFGLKTDVHHTDMRITLDNGSIIFFIGAETKAELEKLRGGSYDLVIIDECKSYNASILRELIFDVCYPACSDRRGTIVLIGTPGSILDGPFYEGTYQGATDEQGVPYSRTYDEPEEYWRTNPSLRWRWSRHSWTLKDNVALPHLWEDALELKRNQRWDDNHPTWLREYLGHWVAQDDVYVYAYPIVIKDKKESVTWRPDYRKSRHGLPEGHDWRFLLGLDLGFEDDFAMVVGAYSLTSGDLYHVYDFKVNHQDVYQVADHISNVLNRFDRKIDASVGDAAGLGKMVIETLNRRHGFQIKPAEKREKYDFIELINADFKAGRIKVIPGSDLETELLQLQWDLTKNTKDALAKAGKLREHPGLPNHLCDAFLYLWRYSYHTYGDAGLSTVKAGSDAWWKQKRKEAMELMEAKRDSASDYYQQMLDVAAVNPNSVLFED